MKTVNIVSLQIALFMILVNGFYIITTVYEL
jgi:hypothetical protein